MDRLLELINKFDDTSESIQKPSLGKVLVIDDDPNIRQGLESTLTYRNYEVIITAKGQEGLEKLTTDICIVLLDVKLPQMDGTEVYILLKEKQPGVPIIFYSAYPGNEENAKKCLELKPYAFIEKGVAEDIDKLYSLIDKACKEKNSVR